MASSDKRVTLQASCGPARLLPPHGIDRNKTSAIDLQLIRGCCALSIRNPFFIQPNTLLLDPWPGPGSLVDARYSAGDARCALIFGTGRLDQTLFFRGSLCGGTMAFQSSTENLPICTWVRMNYGVQDEFGLVSIDWITATALPSPPRTKQLSRGINFKVMGKSKSLSVASEHTGLSRTTPMWTRDTKLGITNSRPPQTYTSSCSQNGFSLHGTKQSGNQ